MSSPDPGTGATRDVGAVRDKKRPPLWLLLLGLLLALIVIGILLAVLLGGSSKKVAVAPVVASTAPSATALTGTGTTGTGATGTAPASSALPLATAPPSPTTPTGAPATLLPTGTAGPTGGATAAPTTAPAPAGGLVGGGSVKPAKASGSLAAGDTLGTVLFAENSAALTDYARTVISDAAMTIKADHPAAIVVSGYTDEIASQPSNKTLSQQRADAVLAQLKTDVGPGTTSYTTKDNGENDPVASNDTDSGRQQNRRATITTD